MFQPTTKAEKRYHNMEDIFNLSLALIDNVVNLTSPINNLNNSGILMRFPITENFIESPFHRDTMRK